MALITLPFWLDRAIALICRRFYKEANFLAHLLVEDPEWQLGPDAAAHPTMGFLRLRSSRVEVLFWKGTMNWIEYRIIADALRKAIRQQGQVRKAAAKTRGMRQLEREIERHGA